MMNMREEFTGTVTNAYARESDYVVEYQHGIITIQKKEVLEREALNSALGKPIRVQTDNNFVKKVEINGVLVLARP